MWAFITLFAKSVPVIEWTSVFETDFGMRMVWWWDNLLKKI
jgi:hypothetical protein